MPYKPLAKFDPLRTSARSRVASLLREHSEAAVNVIVGIMNEPCVDPRARLMAAFGVLDRAKLFGIGEGEVALRRVVREIVHVRETQETIDADNDDSATVEYSEVTNGNGHVNGNGHSNGNGNGHSH